MPRPRTLLRSWPTLRSYSTRSSIDSSSLQRELFRRVAQPVAVLTAHIPQHASSTSTAPTEQQEHNHGATLSSLTSISLSPPLVSFSLRLPSRLASHLASPPTSSNSTQRQSTPSFKLHLLSPEQEDLARLFARQALLPAPAQPSANTNWSIEPKFDSKVFTEIEEKGLGWLECRIVKTVDLWEINSTGQSENEGSEAKGQQMRSQLFIAQVDKVELGEGSGSLAWMEQSYRSVKSKER
ncbi:hypothetical protein JCM5353_004765 [Sporobolomyces roseus]